MSVVVYPCSGEGGAWLAAGLELRPRRDLVDVPIEAEARVAVEAYTLHSCTCLTNLARARDPAREVGKKVEASVKRRTEVGTPRECDFTGKWRNHFTFTFTCKFTVKCKILHTAGEGHSRIAASPEYTYTFTYHSNQYPVTF